MISSYPLPVNFSLLPALQARSIGNYRRRDGPLRNLYATGTHSSYLARPGNLVGVSLSSPTPFDLFRHGFLTFKGLSPMVVRPFSLAYPPSDTIVTKLEINAQRPPASFTHTLVHTRVVSVARGIGMVWGMRGNQSGPRRSDGCADGLGNGRRLIKAASCVKKVRGSHFVVFRLCPRARVAVYPLSVLYLAHLLRVRSRTVPKRCERDVV